MPQHNSNSLLQLDYRLPQKKQAGFTLLEVLVALVFFALIGMVLQQVSASTVNQYLGVRHKLLASWIAENKITELQIAKTLPSPKEYKEEIVYGGQEWQVVAKVTKTLNPDINKVDVDVLLINEETDEKDKKLTLTSFLGRY